MSAFGDLDRIDAAFAAAAVDPSLWASAMETATEAAGAHGAVLLPVKGRLARVAHSRSLHPAFEAYIGEGWVHRDERYRGWPAMKRARVVTEFDFTTPDEIARNAYYQDFLGRHGLRWFAGVMVGDGEDVWVLSIQRTIDQGPFSPAEQARLAALSGRLAGSAALARALDGARVEGALSAFEASGSALILFDGLGDVIRANPAAGKLLGPDLQITRRRLVSGTPDASAALDRALHTLLWTTGASALVPPVILPRREGLPIVAYPMRLAGVTAHALASCQALVVLVDLATTARPPEAALRAAFHLTAAEARLAARLATGEPLDVAADRLGITHGTARSQLKAVFAKTGTHRQPELVALLARFPAAPHPVGTP